LFCQAVACKKCVEKYILSVVEDAHCMSCRRQWSVDFIDATMSKAFRTGKLKEHREDVLLDRERSMLPATQPIVERMYKERELQERVKQLLAQKAEIDVRIHKVHVRIHELRRNGDRVDSAERKLFVKPCVVQGCRGFLSTQYKCGLCSASVCPDCHEVKAAGQEHVCDADAAASVAMISRDSKPCPKCGSMIHRVSGCSQMYCTVPGCRTAFDWNTGRVVEGRIHNPHYYEFMRAQQRNGGGGGGAPQGRELDDIPCGGMPSVRSLVELFRRTPTLAERDARVLADAHRVITHVQDVEIRHTYPAVEPNDFDTNQGLRVKYLMGGIDDTAFKRVLQMREKHRYKVAAINQVLAMLVNVGSDMYRNLVIQQCSPEVVTGTVHELESLRQYANASLSKISQRFSCVAPHVSASWSLSNERA
jgi:hypothetical protein